MKARVTETFDRTLGIWLYHVWVWLAQEQRDSEAELEEFRRLNTKRRENRPNDWWVLPVPSYPHILKTVEDWRFSLTTPDLSRAQHIARTIASTGTLEVLTGAGVVAEFDGEQRLK
jgi:hypothetical protein